MATHKKHHVLKTIRHAILGGDSLPQAKSLCIHNGFSKNQITDTLALYDEFREEAPLDSEDFWDILSYEIFGRALQNNYFEQYIASSEGGLAIFNMNRVPEELKPTLDAFRLLDTCTYSGYELTLSLPTDHLLEVKATEAKIDLKQFEEILAKKKALGLEGELFVLEEEQNRLGPDFPVEHTALLNVGAGYDIRSWRDSESYSRTNELFIEVKTISTKKEIYLTSNELATAKSLGKDYRLHVVRKINGRLFTYKIIDNLANYFATNKAEFILDPTYVLKV